MIPARIGKPRSRGRKGAVTKVRSRKPREPRVHAVRPGRFARLIPRRAAAVAGLFWALVWAAPAAGQVERHRYAAEPVLTFEVQDKPALHLPTDVAVAPDGRVYVADGVNDRIVVFEADGSFLRGVRSVGKSGGQDARTNLANPTGVAVDQEGRLWIADTGNGRILGCDPQGDLVREIRLADRPVRGAPNLTDVAVSHDLTRVWFADNDNHRIGYFDLQTGVLSYFGDAGESIGQFRYPFMLAARDNGDVLITDVINGRVQVFNSVGRSVGTISSYGVQLGNLYRPKGVALDAAGNVWISDGTLNVIQAFRPTGRVIDVVRDPQGQPLHFDSPMGIAVNGGSGSNDDVFLYVVERDVNRVRKFRIMVDPDAPPASPPERAAATLQPRTCTACHLEWMEPFASGRRTEIADVPESPPEFPRVARAKNCISCHDSSVVDSRRRVWIEHGHRHNVEPKPDMNVPSFMPLANGRIVCRTCHSAHTRGGAGESLKDAVFLRVEKQPSDLCLNCHAQYASGAGAGKHYLGPMDHPVPEALLKAGAHRAGDTRSVSCLVCHSAHGASTDLLLVVDATGNELCISCHEQMRPGMFRHPEDERPPHPLFAQLNEQQLEVVRNVGTNVGPDNELICLTCHRMHDAKSHQYLLAFQLAGSQVCMTCHPGQRSLLGSSHDLRTDHPTEENRLGVSAAQGGPCSSCHMFHNYARARESSPIDPSGECLTCHQSGRVASAKTLGPVNHPDAACVDCHDPHRTTHGHYLANSATDLCGECHKDYMALLGGPHDSSRDNPAWPVASRQSEGACLACHTPHGDRQNGLFRAGLAAGVEGPDAACATCHSDQMWGAESAVAAIHPRSGPTLSSSTDLPLVSADDGEQVGCRTCHNPHAGADANEVLLRVAAGEPPGSLCSTCHTSMRLIEATNHSANMLSSKGLQAGACRPCHNAHADPSRTQAALLWPDSLSEKSDQAARNLTRQGLIPVISQHCRACHRPDGPAPEPPIAAHPDEPMLNVPESGSLLPLFGSDGKVSPTGRLACKTCHVPHGREVDADGLALDGRALTPAQRRALQTMVRPFIPPNLCTSCHGYDGLRRFLYFHDPNLRAVQGAVEPPSLWQTQPAVPPLGP